MLGRTHANDIWLDIKFNKVLWWKEVTSEGKHTPGSVPYLVQAMHCGCIKRRVSWCLGINCLDATHLEGLYLLPGSSPPLFQETLLKKRATVQTECNINSQLAKFSSSASVIIFASISFPTVKTCLNLMSLQ